MRILSILEATRLADQCRHRIFLDGTVGHHPTRVLLLHPRPPMCLGPAVARLRPPLCERNTTACRLSWTRLMTVRNRLVPIGDKSFVGEAIFVVWGYVNRDVHRNPTFCMCCGQIVTIVIILIQKKQCIHHLLATT